MLSVGDKVRPSDHACQHLRDAWQSCGEPRRKEALRHEYVTRRARRGTVTQVSESPVAYAVRWDNGSPGADYTCLGYMVEHAD